MEEKFFYIDRKTALNLIEQARNIESSKKGSNSKAYILEDYVILRGSISLGNLNSSFKSEYDQVIETIHELYLEGVNVVPILGYVYNQDNIKVYGESAYTNGICIQQRAKGKELWEREKMPPTYKDGATFEQKEYLIERTEFLSKIPQNHFDKWVKDYKAITDKGIVIDPSKKSNFFYDEQSGFSFIDINYKGPVLFKDVDLYGKESHRQFISYCLLPCHFHQPYYGDLLSKEESDKLIKDNLMIFEKCVQALLKVGVTQEQIFEAITQEQSIIDASSPPREIYGVSKEYLKEILKTVSQNR